MNVHIPMYNVATVALYMHIHVCTCTMPDSSAGTLIQLPIFNYYFIFV